MVRTCGVHVHVVVGADGAPSGWADQNKGSGHSNQLPQLDLNHYLFIIQWHHNNDCIEFVPFSISPSTGCRSNEIYNKLNIVKLSPYNDVNYLNVIFIALTLFPRFKSTQLQAAFIAPCRGNTCTCILYMYAIHVYYTCIRFSSVSIHVFILLVNEVGGEEADDRADET